jgi:hypothetical protein
MARAPTWGDLQTMTFEELVAQHDAMAGTTMVGLNHYFLELHRRVADRQARRMTFLTWVIAALTATNVALVALTIWLD